MCRFIQVKSSDYGNCWVNASLISVVSQYQGHGLRSSEDMCVIHIPGNRGMVTTMAINEPMARIIGRLQDADV